METAPLGWNLRPVFGSGSARNTDQKISSYSSFITPDSQVRGFYVFGKALIVAADPYQ